MSYESKIFITAPNGGDCAEEIARLDLSRMGRETVNGEAFKDVFKRPLDEDFFIGDADREPTKEDKYGDPLKWATVDETLAWLDAAFAASEDLREYRRARLLYGVLQTLKADEETWGLLRVIHYGR